MYIPGLDQMEVKAQVEIFAFMKARGYTPAGRGASGRFQRSPGNRGQRAGPSQGQRVQPPPRGRADMSCINCGRKGHSAQECREEKKEKGEIPCFTCGKTGHEARNCPNKTAARKEVRAIEDAPGNERKPAKVFCIQDAPQKPKSQGQQLGDFIGAPKHQNSNRYQPLSLEQWQNIADTKARNEPTTTTTTTTNNKTYTSNDDLP